MLSSLWLGTVLAFTALAAAIDPFSTWAHERVALPNASIHFRYAGSGPAILLVHGVPEHSLTWDVIGPILAQNYTVIAPDLRGTGESSLALDDMYSAESASNDLKGILDFLNITSLDVVAHDKGVGVATALAINNPDLIRKIVLAEYVLPGYGYEDASVPTEPWTAYQNWQLSFFGVNDVAEYFLRGQEEEEYLTWYFYHSGYSGNAALSDEKLKAYARAVKKPGFLRSAFKYFASQFVDRRFFENAIRQAPLSVPALLLGGEASLSPIELQQQAWGPVFSNPTYDLVPKAGHWIGVENPHWVANRVLSFLDEGEQNNTVVDLRSLADRVSLPQQYAQGGLRG